MPLPSTSRKKQNSRTWKIIFLGYYRIHQKMFCMNTNFLSIRPSAAVKASTCRNPSFYLYPLGCWQLQPLKSCRSTRIHQSLTPPTSSVFIRAPSGSLQLPKKSAKLISQPFRDYQTALGRVSPVWETPWFPVSSGESGWMDMSIYPLLWRTRPVYVSVWGVKRLKQMN